MRKSLKKKGLAFLLSVMLTVSNFSGISAYAADVSGIAEGVADKTAPVITVKEAVQGHGHGDTYCEAPVVTVTDAESASLKIETDIGGTKTETEYQENTVTVPIEGQYVRVEITATNDAGLSAKVRFTISHTLAGRQGPVQNRKSMLASFLVNIVTLRLPSGKRKKEALWDINWESRSRVRPVKALPIQRKSAKPAVLRKLPLRT